MKKVIMTWSLLFALVGFLTIGGALWKWGGDHQALQTEDTQQHSVAPVVKKRVISRFESPTQEAALALVTQALQLRDPSQIPEFFRLGSATPEGVIAFLSGMEESDGPITSYVWLSSMDANGLLLDGVAVNTKKNERLGNRLAIMTPDDKGTWKIDFDAFARTAKPTCDEFMAMTTGNALLRVVFAKDSYYNGLFRDEAVWTCYRIGCAELPNDLYSYCRKDSPQDNAMKRMLQIEKTAPKGSNQKRATLEIRRVAGANNRQVEITGVLAEDWVMSDKPFDQEHKSPVK